MRSIFLSLVLLAGCATTGGANRPVNVAAVRSEINGSIRAQQNDRSIYSMGHVDRERAVVYTQNKRTGAQQEETWLKHGDGWTLMGTTAIAGGTAAAGG